MSRETERKIKSRADDIIAAARVLIGTVRMCEGSEGGRSSRAELELEVDLTGGGGTETWKITIDRTASSH